MRNLLTILLALLCLANTASIETASAAEGDCFDAEKVASINKMGSGSGPGVFDSLSLEVDCENKAFVLAITTEYDPLQYRPDAFETIGDAVTGYMCGEAGFAPAFAKGWTAKMTIQFQGEDLVDPITISDC